jgi:hypothetical protein
LGQGGAEYLRAFVDTLSPAVPADRFFFRHFLVRRFDSEETEDSFTKQDFPLLVLDPRFYFV